MSYWQSFPSEMHPDSLETALYIIFHRGEFDLDKSVLVGSNLVGYGYAKARGIPVMFGSGPLDEETVKSTLEAAMAPDDGSFKAISWALLIQIGMAILEALRNRT